MPLLHDFIRSDEPPRGFHNSHGNQGACARALRMRLTRQRCQLALRTLSSLEGDDAAKAASTSRRRISVAENLAPAVGVDADRDDRRDPDDASPAG